MKYLMKLLYFYEKRTLINLTVNVPVLPSWLIINCSPLARCFQTIFQQLLDGLPLNVADIHASHGMNLNYFGDPLTFPLAAPAVSSRHVKCVNIYWMDWHKLCCRQA